MKSIIYKNPVMSGVILNLSAMCLSVYGIKYNISPLTIAIIPVGILNRKIIDNGVGLNKNKKTIIIISFVVMISVFLLYSEYFHNMMIKQLENM